MCIVQHVFMKRKSRNLCIRCEEVSSSLDSSVASASAAAAVSIAGLRTRVLRLQRALKRHDRSRSLFAAVSSQFIGEWGQELRFEALMLLLTPFDVIGRVLVPAT